MLWDILLPVLAAIAQVVTGFLGWRVTVDGVKEERKRIYEWLFALASLIGIVTVGIAAYRGSQISRDLADLKNGQQMTNSGIQQLKTNPPVVNVPAPIVNVNTPPSPTSIPVSDVELDRFESSYVSGANVNGSVVPLNPMFMAGKPVSQNLYFKNFGTGRAENVLGLGIVFIASTETEKTLTAAFMKEFNRRRHLPKNQNPSGTMEPGGRDEFWFTALSSKMMTDEDVKKLTDSSERLYIFAALTYSDQKGSHFLHICKLLQPPDKSAREQPAIWKFCSDFKDRN